MSLALVSGLELVALGYGISSIQILVASGWVLLSLPLLSAATIMLLSHGAYITLSIHSGYVEINKYLIKVVALFKTVKVIVLLSYFFASC